LWPTGGPSWDALGIISDSNGKVSPGVILVEAKSHISEIYGPGCQAGPHSRDLIERSLATAKQWCGARADANWTGPLYQSANRLAHLYFIRERLQRPAWLVNLYFLNDPIGPADRDAWNIEIQKVKSSLGLDVAVPFAMEIFLPALTAAESQPGAGSAMADSDTGVPEGANVGSRALAWVPQNQPVSAPEDDNIFVERASRWMLLANYDGPRVPDVPMRIEQLVRQWQEPIPGSWQRGVDMQLHGKRYRRSDIEAPNPGEHTIEHEILCRHFEQVSCFGNSVLDGVNALPLVRDARGGRAANVEADMLLLTKGGEDHRLFLCEVKAESNNAWYAAVENLRQLRLLMSSPESRGVFFHRCPTFSLPADIPVTALVLAPYLFYSSRGKKANSVEPALKLLARFTSEFNVDVRLAVWDPKLSNIKSWVDWRLTGKAEVMVDW